MNAANPPLSIVRAAVALALAEDLVPLGDLTSSLLPPDTEGKAAFVSRGEGVVAGAMCAVEAFQQVDPSVTVRWVAADGSEVSAGDVLGRVEGSLSSILTAERTALNFLCHLSGVATTTRRWVRTARDCRIRDTRKTTPGLRALEKAAVRAGGGTNHRGSLSDGILVKDNHLGSLTVADAVRRAHLRWPGRTIEVECDSIEQMEQAIDAGADMVLLDNMSPEMVARAVEVNAGRLPLEVSGGVSFENLSQYAATGVDFISAGAITHSAPSFDIGLDLET